MALDEFIEWYGQAPRPGFTKATVSTWRVSLEARGLGSPRNARSGEAVIALGAYDIYGDTTSVLIARYPGARVISPCAMRDTCLGSKTLV